MPNESLECIGHRAVMKTRIVEHLGNAEVLLPSLVAVGLAANDRIKVRMSELQAATEHARDPGRPPADLTAECRNAGIDPSDVACLIGGARLTVDGHMTTPDLINLGKGILADLGLMLHAVEIGAPAEGKGATKRLAALKVQESLGSLREITPSASAELIGVSEGDSDSLHRVVMDLHKALNRLAVNCAEEVVDGAHAYGLFSDDRSALQAFMRGLASTADLKFDHPGLETTAMRSGPRLIIQNDIGATDAHVVMIAVESNAVTITYTDVHRSRSKFFANLLSGFPTHWSGTDQKRAQGLGEEGIFYLITGNYAPETDAQRDQFLEAIGRSLVFLIDWNKARKALRPLVPKNETVRILDWAARNQIGHRAFLEFGGSELITTAVHNAAATRIGFGERLDTVLGRESAVDFLKTVLKICTDALREGRSARTARDRIEAELVRRIRRVDATLLAGVVRQAGLAREVAASIAGHIANLRAGRSTESGELRTRARHIEEKADRIAIQARAEIARLDAGATMLQLVDRIEEAIDELEQAAFIASLAQPDIEGTALASLADLCATALGCTEAAASGADAAAEVPEGRRSDTEDALAAVTQLVELEHKADDAERAITALVLRGGFDLPRAFTVLELARAIERATDRLASFGHVLRAHVLADLTS
jgi:uncharacterized protein Yka (UPF0111/DUF47 family)